MNPSTYVFSFPIKAPESAVFTTDAEEQLWLWEMYQDYYCEHKPSITINYTKDEFLQIGQKVWDALEELSGVSFLPKDDHVYPQAPYQTISAEEYYNREKLMPKKIDWNRLNDLEVEDMTTAAQELACSSGFCEI